jgi:hypothetical protein
LGKLTAVAAKHRVVSTNDTMFQYTERGVNFDVDQQARLQAVFAAGVCDWGNPGVSRQRFTTATGTPSPPAPVSTPQ